MAWASRRGGPSRVRKSGPIRGLNFINAAGDDVLPPAVAKARLDTGWSVSSCQVSACRGVCSGECAESVQQEAARLGPEVASGCVQTETLERRRRDAPWISSSARQSKRAKPTLATAVSIASSSEQMWPEKMIRN